MNYYYKFSKGRLKLKREAKYFMLGVISSAIILIVSCVVYVTPKIGGRYQLSTQWRNVTILDTQTGIAKYFYGDGGTLGFIFDFQEESEVKFDIKNIE